jgi:hypothetical protein
MDANGLAEVPSLLRRVVELFPAPGVEGEAFVRRTLQDLDALTRELAVWAPRVMACALVCGWVEGAPSVTPARLEAMRRFIWRDGEDLYGKCCF